MSNEHPTNPGIGSSSNEPEQPQYRHNANAPEQNQWQQWQDSPLPRYSQQPPQQYSQQPPQNPPYNYEGTDGDSKFKPIMGIILAAILAIALILGAAYYLGWIGNRNDNGGTGGGASQSQEADGSSSSGDDEGDDAAQGEESDSDGQDSEESAGRDEGGKDDDGKDEEDAEDSRPTRPKLPSGAVPANQSAEQNKPAGDFNNVYTGSDITSKPFARAVRDAFVTHYLDTDETEGTVKAHSSVTGQTYTMKCKDNGQYVTCTGGNNAIVYIA